MLKVTSTLARSLSHARPLSLSARASSGHRDIMDDWPPEKFDKHFIDYFSRPEIDGWEVRKGSFSCLQVISCLV